MRKLINLFEQDDAVDKEWSEVSAHSVFSGRKDTYQRAPETRGIMSTCQEKEKHIE